MIDVTWGETKIRSPRETNELTRIILEVCQKYKVSYREMVSIRKAKYIAHPRQEAYYRCYHETAASYPEIGRAFKRDHTSIMFGVRRHESRQRNLTVISENIGPCDQLSS